MKTGEIEVRLTKVISVLLHPLLIPTYTYLLLVTHFSLIALQIPAEMEWVLAGLVFITSFGLPAMIIILMLKLKMISSLAMSSRQERPMPLILTAVFFYLTYLIFKHLNVAPLFYFYMLGATALAIVCFAVNFVYKISLHTTALGAIVGTIIGLSSLMNTALLLPLIVAILLAGITAFARLRLGAHKSSEIYVGFLTGVGFMLMFFLLL